MEGSNAPCTTEACTFALRSYPLPVCMQRMITDLVSKEENVFFTGNAGTGKVRMVPT